jgi:hypothetical protein
LELIVEGKLLINRRNRALLYLLAFLVLAFGYDKVGAWAVGLPRLHLLVYLWISLLILIILGIPSINKLSRAVLILAGTGSYLVCRILFFSIASIRDPHLIPAILVELVSIILAVLLATQLSYQFEKDDFYLEKIFRLTPGRPVRDIDHSLEEIRAELNRSRRFNHPLTFLVFEVVLAPNGDEGAIPGQVRKPLSPRLLNENLIEILLQQSRRYDMVLTQGSQNRMYLLCPESKYDGAMHLARRIDTEARKRLNLTLRYGISTFPDQALTFDELLGQAETDLAKKLEKRCLKGW